MLVRAPGRPPARTATLCRCPPRAAVSAARCRRAHVPLVGRPRAAAAVSSACAIYGAAVSPPLARLSVRPAAPPPPPPPATPVPSSGATRSAEGSCVPPPPALARRLTCPG
eukprot:2456925-Pleurochrysis_carterae.AAC.1